jgi:hypothetical protein
VRWSCHAETTSASQLEAHLRAASAEQIPENRDIDQQSSRQTMKMSSTIPAQTQALKRI